MVTIDGDKVTVETESGGKRQEIVVPADECYHTNHGADTPDHCMLVHLSPPTLLENTRARFAADKIYTYVGDILVAINPFKWIKGIYDESVMKQCEGKKLHNTACGPHCFSISERAFVVLKKTEKSQCVVVSGESGAGKTETNRQLMNYLVYRGSTPGVKNELTQKIMDANPILESFGNAKTTRNKNSSRFGRYVLVRFSADYKVIGAQVRTFLLERSRVTAASNDGERAYHVLYQIILDGTYCQPTDPMKHRYTSLSGCTTVDTIDDLEWFKENNDALKSVGVTDDERKVMWGMVAAMVYLGSLDFGEGDTAALGDAARVGLIESLLGIGGLASGDRLLLTRSIKIGTEVTRVEHNPSQAGAARDALVKIMYARLFDWLVARINVTVDAPGEKNSSRYIGLLDVYGFEFFAVNSFEQLCINFANEKLQQFFLQTVFENEANAYKEEGIPWTPIAYADNKDIIELCEKPTTGIYSILDNACRTPNSSGKTFCGALHKQHNKSPVLSAPKVSRKETRSKDDHFIVKHFAGDVVYFAGEFLEKNNDSLDADVEGALLKSSFPLVVTVCTPEAEPAAGGKKKKASSFASVGDKFVKSLRSLMTDLASSQAHFVRCIKPNPELVPNKIHGKSVIEQLRMSGTLDAVKLIQAGYPARIPYEDIYSRYKSMMPKNVQDLPAPDFCEVIAAVCDIGKNEYALGVTRMFFRLGSAALLEELGDMDPKDAEPIIKEKVALFEKKAKAKPMVEKTLLMWVFKRRYKVLVAEHRRKMEEARRAEEERKRKEEEAQRRQEEEERQQREAEARRQAEENGKLEAYEAEQAALKAKADEANAAAAAAAAAGGAAPAHTVTVEELAQAEEQECAAAVLQLQAADAMVQELEESEEDVHAAVEAQGGIRGVIMIAADHVGSADVQAQFVGLMRDLCISDEIADEIAAAGGVEKILESAKRHFDVPDVMMEVADAIRNLTAAEPIALRAAEGGAIEVLVDAAARHTAEEAVSRAVVGALWALSVHDALVSKLVHLGCVQSVIAVAKAMPKDEDVQSSAAALIRNLAINEDVRCTVAEKGGIALLIGAAENHPQAPEVGSQVACALWNLSQTKDVASEMATSGAVEVLVALAHTFAGDATVQLGVAGCLRLVCVSDSAAETVVKAGGVPALMEASRAHLRRVDVQRAFIGALLELATHGHGPTVTQAGGVAAVLRAAEAHDKEERLQARAAGVLRLLAVDDESKVEIASAGGINLLVSAAKHFPGSPAVQAEVAGALAVLAVDDSLEEKIGVEAGGIVLLLEALDRHPKSSAVAAHAWHALTNLSVSASNKKALVAAPQIKAVVATALQAHEGAPRVIEGIATTIRNLCLPAGPTKTAVDQVCDAGSVQRLVNILRAHQETTIVSLAIAGALRAISADPPHAVQLGQLGAKDALLGALDKHKDDERLRKEVESAVRRIDDAGGVPSSPAKPAAAPTQAASPSAVKMPGPASTSREQQRTPEKTPDASKDKKSFWGRKKK